MHAQLDGLPDHRRGKNTIYAIKDAALGAFTEVTLGADYPRQAAGLPECVLATHRGTRWESRPFALAPT